MKLVSEECVECGACTDKCPYALSTKILDCTQCNACVETCNKNAFYEIMPGIYSIDQSLCDGCGECFCPYDALEIKDYARKCDLCGGEPKCIEVCLKDLRLEYDEKEKALNKLGWEKIEGEYKTHAKRLLPHELKAVNDIRKLFKELIKQEDVTLKALIQEYCREYPLKEKQENRVLETLKHELQGFSVLDHMLEDKELEEITVKGMDCVRVFHRSKGWLRADVRFIDQEKIMLLINKMAREVGQRISIRHPRLNAVLPNGQRLHAIVPPLARYPNMTIRKFDKNLFSPEELVKKHTISHEAMDFLSKAIKCDVNALICGSTGSGKTTTLDCLASFIPLKERVVIVEETPEVHLPHEHQVKLRVNEALGISMNELIKDTMRMRPDRVIIGEIRSEKEVKAFMNSILAGQGKGSLATFHALSSEDALKRLMLLGAKKTELDALDLIIVQKRWTEYGIESMEKRRIVEISEVHNSKPRKIFEHEYAMDKLTKKQEPLLEEKIRRYIK